MNLEKFKYITNSYITSMRDEVRKSVIDRLQSGDPDSKKIKSYQASGKCKYIFQLPIRPFEDEKGEHYICDTNWPVCMFDHIYKKRYATFFRYRVPKQENEWKEDYLGENKEVISYKEDTSGIMIENNKHYCENSLFIEKINKILTAKELYEDAFPEELIEFPIDDINKYKELVKNFIEYILSYKIPDSKSN